MHGRVALSILAGAGLVIACPEPRADRGSASPVDSAPASRSAPPAASVSAQPPDATPAAGTPPQPLDTAGFVPQGAAPFYGGFAYADGSGTRLLAVTQLAYPAAVLRAVCQSSSRLPVRFDRHQPLDANSDGRQGARNFDRDEGDLYQVQGNPARSDETCFLVGPDLVRVGSLAAPQPSATTQCDPADSARLAEARARPVASCDRLRSIDSATFVLAVLFEDRGDSALASLVLADSARFTFLDLPGERREGGDTWREGDGGEFHPEDFDVLFVIVGPTNRAIAVTWDAEEGQSLTLSLAPEGATSFERVVHGYRYWMAY